MKRIIGWLAAVALVFAAIALLYYTLQQRSIRTPGSAPPAAAVAPPAQIGTGPQILYPVPADQPSPLPALNDSDTPLGQALAALIDGNLLAEILVPADLIRHIVVTVDNLPRKKVALRLLPVKTVPGRIVVSGGGGNALLDTGNSARYAPYVRIAQATDTKKLIALYIRFYPLFQQAYQELGYPHGYFNDRLVAVFDDLLAAPEIKDPLRLIQPKVMYEFADPELEARSAGQKILIRMGSANAVRVKAKLRDIRNELIGSAAARPN